MRLSIFEYLSHTVGYSSASHEPDVTSRCILSPPRTRLHVKTTDSYRPSSHLTPGATHADSRLCPTCLITGDLFGWLSFLQQAMPGQRVRFADHGTTTFSSAGQPRSTVGRSSRFEKAGVLPEILSDVTTALNDLCGNCSRPLYVDGTFAIFNEQSESYCSQNCRWTAMLDTNGSRHRRAKRAAAKKDRPKRRRREPLVLDDEEFFAASSNDTESDDDFGGTGGNALFGYYCNFGGGTTLKERPLDSFSIPLPDSTNVN